MSLENINIWNVICYRKDIMCRILYNPNETELSITVSIFVKIG